MAEQTVETYDETGKVGTRTITVPDPTPEQVTQKTIDDYLLSRRARLTVIRTQAAAVTARAATSGNPTAGQLTALQTDIKTLAAAVDDLAQFDIRLSRRVLGAFDSTD